MTTGEALAKAWYDGYVAGEIDTDKKAWWEAMGKPGPVPQRAICPYQITRKNRRVTDHFLKQVAAVYRKNFAHAPTQAVAEKFNVSLRMASIYVDRARQVGHLPPTTQGRKLI